MKTTNDQPNTDKAMFSPGYFVDSNGDCWSRRPWRGMMWRKLKLFPCNHGYLRVRCSIRGVRKAFYVHKLVAASFLPLRPTPTHEIRHLDGCKQNNASANLSWGTRKDNALDRSNHGRTARGSQNGASKLCPRDVKSIRRMACGGIPQRIIAKRFGVSQNNVSRIVGNKTWSLAALRKEAE